MVINPLYSHVRIMVCRVVGGARTVDGQAYCLEDQILSRCFLD